MADHDRIEGAAKQTGGSIKEGLGKLTGDEKLKAEGRADKVEGKVQNTVGGIKDSLKGDGRH
ncbi:CsbD family protein [Brevundimonas aurifodinae]|uniref:CsbD family protein n=2 Tax=Brevundimonas TaxID=41275 RepID=A0ABV1NPK3_9CAUL|nr:MAG: CsbD family protein [Brevundimonas sp. 12-68-7]OYX35986.1 MAG: CsbD family protein [Brevundimonas subvibrioides]